MTKISIFGDNLIAYVTACCFSDVENQIILCSMNAANNAQVLTRIQSIDEPFFQACFTKNLEDGRVRLTDDIFEAIKNSDVCFLAFENDLPAKHEHFKRKLLGLGGSKKLIILQGFQSVGTWDTFEKDVATQFHDVVVVPSFLKEGEALKDFKTPDRIIIGAKNLEIYQKVKALYQPIIKDDALYLFMSPKEAEFTRVAVNSMLAIRLSLVNEMANAAEQLGVDIKSVLQGLGSDARIGTAYLNPGCGFGGDYLESHLHEFAKLIEHKLGDPALLIATLKSNQTQKESLFRKIWRYYLGDLKGKKVAFWGTAFKPISSSVNRAPSLTMAQALSQQDVIINAYDPMANVTFLQQIAIKHNVFCVSDPYQALIDADALIILTEWDEFRKPDFIKIKKRMKNPVIFDGRNLYNPSEVEAHGIQYYAVGRGRTI